MRLRIVFLAFLVFLGLCSHARAEDCGIRGNDGGTDVVQLDCQDAATFATSPSPLKIRTPSGIRGLTLVNPEDIGASKFRVRYTDGSGDHIKAIGFVSSGAAGMTPCETLQMIGYHPDPKYALSGTYSMGDDIDCSATNPANTASINCSTASTTPGSLWKCGYAKRFNSMGVDGNPDVSGNPLNDDSIPALEGLETGGFKPIGNSTTKFTGTFNGQGHKVQGLYIARPTEDYAGLFGYTSGATISNVGITDGSSVSGANYPGGLVGAISKSSSVINCYSRASVTSSNYGAGGLVGNNNASTITRSYASGSVTAVSGGGGFVGHVSSSSGLFTCGSFGTVSQCYSTGTVTFTSATSAGSAGGFVGSMSGGKISDSYAAGNVNGTALYAGGFIGSSSKSLFCGSFIDRSYASGFVAGRLIVGGFLGYNGSVTGLTNGAVISNSFSTGPVAGSVKGGFLGENISSIKVINNCAWVKGSLRALGCNIVESTYGLCGSYWDPDVSLLSSNGWGTDSASLSAFHSTSHPVYSGWEFTSVWRSRTANLPCLRWDTNCA